MSVAFDANATSPVSASGVTTIDLTTLTVGTGANRALVVQLSHATKTITNESMNWDQTGSPQACTSIKAANGSGSDGRAELWGLVAPTSGAKTLRHSWTGISDVIINAVSWTGADQTGGATTFPNSTSATGTSTTPSVTVTSAVNHATMDASAAPVASSPYSAPSKTQTYATFEGNIIGAGSRAAGAASNVHSWTIVSGPWVSVGTDIIDATTNPTGPFPTFRPDLA